MLDRALHGLPDLPSRRAVLRHKILCSPVSAAVSLGVLLRRSLAGTTSDRDATIALASTLIDLHRAGDLSTLWALRAEALRADLPALASLLVDAPAHRALAARGRLAEVCIAERAPLRRWPLALERDISRSQLYLRRRLCLDVGFVAHPSPILIGRLLQERWLPLSAALSVAARRPTTPALAFELASHDRWIQRIEVREAMAQNPFIPTSIVLSLLPSIRQRLLGHLRDAGDAHPQVSVAAAELLALRC